MSALRVLTALFSVDTAKANTSLKQLDGLISQTKGTLGTLAASVAGAFSISAFKHFIGEQIDVGSRLNDTSEKLGVTTDALQKFQYAAKLSGVDTEAAGTALQFLNKNLGEAIGGSAEQAKTFKDLGIDIASIKDGTQTATDLLPDLAKKFEGIGSDAERTATAMKLFGRSGASLIPLLKSGSGELQKMFEKFEQLGGEMDEGFIKLADQAGDEIDTLKFAFNGLKSRVAVEVLPTVIEFAKKLQEMAAYAIKLTKETTVVRTALSVLGVVGAVAGAKAALGWAKFFGLFPKGNMGIVKTLASLGGIGLAIGAVAAVALAVDDLAVAFDGGDSAIKAFLTKAGGVEYATKYIDDMKSAWDSSKGSIEQLQEPLGEVGKAIADLARENAPEIIYAFDYIARVIGTAVVSLVTFIKLLGQLKNIADADFTKKVDKILGSYTDTLLGKENADGKSYGGLWGDTDPNKRMAPKKFDGPSYLDPSSPDFVDVTQPYAPPQAMAVPGGATTVQGDTNVTQSNQITVNVVGATTNDETGRRVGRDVKSEIEKANQQALGALQTGAGG